MSPTPPGDPTPMPSGETTVPLTEIIIPLSDYAVSMGISYVWATVTSLVVCLIPVAARIYVRCRPVLRFGWDDCLMGAGLICAIADWAIFFPVALLNKSQTSTAAEMRIYAIRSYFGIPVWTLAMTLIKTSVILTLLRLPLKRTSKAVLYTLMFVIVSYCICAVSYQLFRCRPIQAGWDVMVQGYCPKPSVTLVVANLGAGINIVSDIIVSVAPAVIFWRLRRPLRERLIICSLTCLGLFASGASIIKVWIIHVTQEDTDIIAMGARVAKWTVLEELMSITAACSPAMKRPIEFLLGKCGIVLIQPESVISFVHMGSRHRRSDRRRSTMRRGGTDGSSSIQLNPMAVYSATRHNNRHAKDPPQLTSIVGQPKEDYTMQEEVPDDEYTEGWLVKKVADTGQICRMAAGATES
ncbi:hypothetical protein QBC38DRAFT_456308 [Podospora fimiseda]|uniref:Rhodopsin domain-containing protein n=1 Tax=Podospora fimiseda TaxID=252190 RepID=A0AAN7BMN6_9PEZI|nr:hypothetical protein QBC38DRAFT_456308 [Podospora fimiseda]